MHINDLASLEVLVVEVEDNEPGLGDHWQELLLSNFCVLSVTVRHVLGMLRLLYFQGGQSHISHGSEHFVFSIRVEVRIAILFLGLDLLGTVVLFGFHFLLDHLGLILDCFIHNHLVEDVTCKLHVLASFFTHFKIQNLIN